MWNIRLYCYSLVVVTVMLATSVVSLVSGQTFELTDFYRVTHMRSADYAISRCPSVCPSHAGIVPKRLYVSWKFFSPSGNPTILVFLYLSDGNTAIDIA